MKTGRPEVALLVLLCLSFAHRARAATYYIDPSAATNGSGTSQSSPYNTWNFGALTSGNTYLQRGGTTFPGIVTDSASSVTIGVYGSGTPTIAVMNFSGASNSTFGGYILTGSASGPMKYAAIIIQNNSSYITVSNNTIETPPAGGILVNSGAGPGNTVSNNFISGASGVGITISPTTATAAAPTVVYRNVVTGSGGDGILVDANYTQVTRNRVSNNGNAGPGASGIHVYTPSGGGQGRNNVIYGNVSIANVDAAAYDGNGIQLDQGTSGNTVNQNLLLMNDGPGLSLLDSSNNTVTQNVIFSNGEDRGGHHLMHAELILNTETGATANNTIESNSLVGYFSNVNAAYIGSAVVSAGNIFSGNTLAVAGSWYIYDLAGSSSNSPSYWNTTLGASDSFVPPAVTAPTGGPYDYSFPASMELTVDGVIISLIGWNPSPGLYGQE